jgi:predicted dehydrogenase
MERVRVGIVGTGFVARLHAHAWRRVHGIDVRLVSVASAREERAEAFARAHGIDRASVSAEGLLAANDVDVVDLCVPNHLHASFARDALRAGKHVVVEKPLTGCFAPRASVAAREMLESAVAEADSVLAAGAGTRHVCYAENWVYAPPFVKARELLTEAGGAVLRIQGEESHSGTHSEPNKHWVTAGGGALLGKGCHPLGAALYLKRHEGARPASVVAVTASLTKSARFDATTTAIRSGYEDVEDYGMLVLTFDDGTVAEIVGADTSLGGVRNRMTAFGTNVVVEANLNPNSAVRAYAPDAEVLAGTYLSEKLETHAGWTQPSPDEDWMQGYPQEMQDFAEAIAYERAPHSDSRLGRDVCAVVYGAYLAAETGTRVDLSPWFP